MRFRKKTRNYLWLFACLLFFTPLSVCFGLNYNLERRVLTIEYMRYKNPKISFYRDQCINSFLISGTLGRWVPSKNMDYWNPYLGLKEKFKKGFSMRGIPYTQKRRYTSFVGFLLCLEEKDGRLCYVGPSSSYLGSDCSSAIMYAFKDTVDPYCKLVYTGSSSIMEDFTPVGDFVFDEVLFETKGTAAICNSGENGEKVMFASYSKLRPADIVLKHVKRKDGRESGHVRMVLDVDIKNQKVIYADQTGVNEKGDFKGQNKTSTWQIGESASFKELYDEGYVPLASIKLLELEMLDPIDLEKERSGIEAGVGKGADYKEKKQAGKT